MTADTVTAPDSEQTTPAGNSDGDTVTETPKETPESILKRLKVDDTDVAMWRKTEKAIVDYNAGIKELKALSDDPAEVAEGIKESDDPEIVSLRDAVEKAQAALTKRQETLDNAAKVKAEEKIAANTDKAKVDELTAKTDKLHKRIKATVSALVTDYGDDVKAAFTDLVSKRTGTGTATGRGAGVSRPRNFTLKVNGEIAVLPNNSGDKVSSFSAAAKAIGGTVKTQDIQNKYFESEGSDAEKWIPGKVVTFTVNNGEKDFKVEAVKNRD